MKCWYAGPPTLWISIVDPRQLGEAKQKGGAEQLLWEENRTNASLLLSETGKNKACGPTEI